VSKRRTLVMVAGQATEVMVEWFSYGWCAFSGRTTRGWTVARHAGGPCCVTEVITGLDREVAIAICMDMSKLEQKTAPAQPRLDDLKDVARRYLGAWIL